VTVCMCVCACVCKQWPLGSYIKGINTMMINQRFLSSSSSSSSLRSSHSSGSYGSSEGKEGGEVCVVYLCLRSRARALITSRFYPDSRATASSASPGIRGSLGRLCLGYPNPIRCGKLWLLYVHLVYTPVLVLGFLLY
jgi:hypothetical protein